MQQLNMMLKLISVLWTMVVLLQHGFAQVDYNPKSNTIACAKTGGQYCVNGSLNGSIMLSCVSTTLIEIRSCNIQLSNYLPHGYENDAVCYESSTGNAICAFNGTGYTLTGTRVSVPETIVREHIPILRNGHESASDAVRPDLTAPTGTIWDMDTTAAAAAATKGRDPVHSDGFPSSNDTVRSTETMDVSTTAPEPAPTHTVKPVSLIATSSNVQSTTSNLPLDATGKPYVVVSEIDSTEPDITTSTALVTSMGKSTTMVFTTTAVGEEAPSSSSSSSSSPSKGVMLVEPSESATADAATGARAGGSSAGTPAAGAGTKVLRWVVVVGGLMGLLV